MAANPFTGKIVALLSSEAHERQIAAAIVLGELGLRDATVIAALADAVAGGVAPVQRHALDALARLASPAAARRALPAVLDALGARDEAVRHAAVEAGVAFGDSAVGAVRGRLGAATDPGQRRALEAVLARVGGKDAFATLLAELDTPDVEAARAAALVARQRIKDAAAREKAAYLAQITKLLRARAPGARQKGAAVGMVAGGLKLLGYLEDPEAAPTLLAFARDAKLPAAVREEAVVALRFVARGKSAPVAAALVALAESAPPALARAALYSLAVVELPAALAPRLGAVARTGDAERAPLAIERLAQMSDPAGADALAGVLAATGERARAEAAAAALVARPDGALGLGRALAAVRDDERAALLARLLRPRARSIIEAGAPGKKLAAALVAAALARVGRGGPDAEALLPLARELDRAATAAGLRAEATRRRHRRDEAGALAILRLVGQSTDATAEDGYALGSAELNAGRRDEALAIFGQLVGRGFDLGRTVRSDRRLTPEQRYQIGFDLVERGQTAGEEILDDLARAGRSKVATMAKAKLKSAGLA